MGGGDGENNRGGTGGAGGGPKAPATICLHWGLAGIPRPGKTGQAFFPRLIEGDKPTKGNVRWRRGRGGGGSGGASIFFQKWGQSRVLGATGLGRVPGTALGPPVARAGNWPGREKPVGGGRVFCLEGDGFVDERLIRGGERRETRGKPEKSPAGSGPRKKDILGGRLDGR